MAENHATRTAAILAILGLVIVAAVGAAEEKVAFNVESKKYHCLSCRWAIACTKNCVEIPI